MGISTQEKLSLIQFIKSSNLQIKWSVGWENFARNVKLPDALVFDVENIKSLQEIVKYIYILNDAKEDPKSRLIVRVAAGGGTQNKHGQSHALTPCIDSSIVLRLIGDEFKEINTTDRKNVIRVGGSVQIGDLDKILFKKFHLSLPICTLSQDMTVAGLMGNAGYGTGIRQPAFSGFAVSMTFCLPNGEIVKIDEDYPDFKTIRAAHLGVFGIVLNVELKCLAGRRLECMMQAKSLPELLNEIKDGLFLNDSYVSVMYVPTYHKNELKNKKIKNVIIYRWRPVIAESKPKTNNHPHITNTISEIESKIGNGFRIADLLRYYPKIAPYYMMYAVTRYTICGHDHVIIDPWLNLNQDIQDQISSIDFLFEAEKNCHEINDALVYLVKTLAESAKNNEFPVDCAAHVKMLKGTNGGLSTSSHEIDKYVCGFDIISSGNTKGYELFRQKMIDYLMTRLNAKPHWGKDVPTEVDYLQVYGKNFTTFKRVLHDWYKKNDMMLEKGMLLNGFLCRILKLPHIPYSENLHKREPVNDLVFPTQIDLAKEMLSYIEGDDVYAKNFRQCIKKILQDDAKQILLLKQEEVDSEEDQTEQLVEEESPVDVSSKRTCTIF